MIDFTLTDEQQLLRETARDFAERELAPAVEQIYAAHGHAVEPWPQLEPAFRRGCELGFVSVLIPEEHGGHSGSCVDAVILLEELGAVDTAVAASYFALTATLAQLIARAGTEEQKERWLAPVRAGKPILYSGALSEPHRAGSDLFCPTPDPSIGVQTEARRDGDNYVLTGRKSAFVTNAGVADAYLVMARSTFHAPPVQSLSMFYVPADTPGLSVGKRTALSGWRTSYHAELILDGARVPRDNLIGEEGRAGVVLASSPEIGICLAACFVGLARAAHEYALGYARERVSWGVPLVEHQAVALRLAEMAVDLQAARLLVWDAARAADTDPLAASSVKAPAAKTFAVDVAIRNAQRAVEVLGGYGVASEYRAARYLNDAWVGWSCDFTRDMLLLSVASALTATPDNSTR